ncbi:alpha/beta fold hydrolase [Flavilitoribacter nigricans]|nr:alpha/beta fold hydrolase [Flavilitoribacter nigricans]
MQKTETKYAQSGKVNIAYQIVGEGSLDLIIVAGWVTNVEEMWNMPELAAWLNRLSQFCRLIIFDKRGTGLSDRVEPGRLPGITQRMQDLRAIVEAADSREVAVLGLSEGGPLATLFAVEYPELVSHLLLYGSYARWIPDGEYPWGLSRQQHQKTLEHMQSNWGQPIGLHLMAPSRANDPATQERWATYLRRSASPGTAAALYRMNIEIDIREVLPKVTVPSLILHRTDDRLIEFGHSQYMHRQIPGAQLVQLPGDDHLPWFGDITEVIDAIQSFLIGGKAVVNAQDDILNPEDVTALYQVRQFLQESYAEKLQLKTLARRFGLNQYKLKYGFRKLFDTPVIAYQHQLRLETAKTMLRTTDIPIVEIADAVGYRQANNFSAAFKREFGMTPSHFRKLQGTG